MSRADADTPFSSLDSKKKNKAGQVGRSDLHLFRLTHNTYPSLADTQATQISEGYTSQSPSA